MDIDNKTLAMVLVAAIVISIGGTIISLNKLSQVAQYNQQHTTGYAVTSGQARVNITSTSSLKFSIASIDFGDGYINTTGGFNNCTMYANNSGVAAWKTLGCAGFVATMPLPFVIENDGNQDLNVTLRTDANGTAYLGGTGLNGHPVAQLKYAVFDNETGSCPSGIFPGIWTDVNTTNPGTNICSDLKFDQGTDTIAIGILVMIPDDATSGVKLVNLTATGN